MLVATCHCGAVEIRVADRLDEVTECNCSICRRYGVLWGYFAPQNVEILTSVPTDTYVWGRQSQAFHRCATCGCVTHWARFEAAPDSMGVNARLFTPDILAAARLRSLNGAVTDRYLDE